MDDPNPDPERLRVVNELLQYCSEGNLDLVRSYLNSNSSIVNCVDNEGQTPLYSAACSGNIELCQYLISSNADANQQTEQDFYPLHGASSRGHETILSLLLQHTTGINSQDSNGDTALHLACCRGNEECVNILLEAGAAIDVKNNMGKTPAMEAASNSHFNIMQLLKDFDQTKDLDPNCRSLTFPLEVTNSQNAPIVSLPLFSPSSSTKPRHKDILLESDFPPHDTAPKFLNNSVHLSPCDSEPMIGSLPELLSPCPPDLMIVHNRPASEQGYHEFSSLRNNCSRKFSELPPYTALPLVRYEAALSRQSIDSAFEVSRMLERSTMSEGIIKHMFDCFQPSQQALLCFRLCMVKELVQRQASQNNIAKLFFSILHTLKQNASPEISELINKIYSESRIVDIYDLYTNFNVGNGMRLGIDFLIVKTKESLLIKDPNSNKVELISMDAKSEKMGAFNLKIALLTSEHGLFYDSTTERVNNEKLLKYLGKYDPAYQIMYHPFILQPSHIYYASAEEYSQYLISQEIVRRQLSSSAFFLITPIFEISLDQFLHIKSEDFGEDFDPTKELTVLSILSNCLLALEHLRQYGIVHRNLKPQNIIVDVKHKKALLSNFTWCINLNNSQSQPYTMKSLSNTIPYYCNESFAPELSHFSSLPVDQLSEVEIALPYQHVDIYSIGRSFYQNIFMKETDLWPMQKYNCEDPFTFHSSSSLPLRNFLQCILLSLISSSPQSRLAPLTAAKTIFSLLSLEEHILREPSEIILTSLLTARIIEDRFLSPSSLYFHVLCEKEDIIRAQNYYLNK